MKKPKSIPIAAARRIAEQYGYEQVLIYANAPSYVDPEERMGLEHMTTYGVTKLHCKKVALFAKWLQEKLGWKHRTVELSGDLASTKEQLESEITRAMCGPSKG